MALRVRMVRTAISPRLAIRTFLNIFLELRVGGSGPGSGWGQTRGVCPRCASLGGGLGFDEGAPAAVFGDIFCAGEAVVFADKAVHPAAVGEFDVADA